MKTAGILMIILFSTCLGVLISSYKREQLRQLNNCIYLLEKVGQELNGSAMSTEKILCSIREDERLKDFKESWRNEYLGSEENSMLFNAYNSLGKSDIQSQLSFFKNTVFYFEDRYKERKNYYETHKKLYLAFGFSGGVLFSVLVM